MKMKRQTRDALEFIGVGAAVFIIYIIWNL